ncbi:aldo/keto reductase family oxidoreductase, partial [Bacillus subtilis subsp. subtilis NCIB 3610 = ATCC 6051 = DSM 10]
AEAFEELRTGGKVKYFGVSNHNPMQIELLQKYIQNKLVINQLQFSIAHTPMIDSGITLNMKNDQAINRDSSILEYCRLKDITIQAWSPFQHGFFEGTFLGDLEKFPELNKTINRIADKYGITNTAVA